jgi:hypothetical protein
MAVAALAFARFVAQHWGRFGVGRGDGSPDVEVGT